MRFFNDALDNIRFPRNRAEGLIVGLSFFAICTLALNVTGPSRYERGFFNCAVKDIAVLLTIPILFLIGAMNENRDNQRHEHVM